LFVFFEQCPVYWTVVVVSLRQRKVKELSLMLTFIISLSQLVMLSILLLGLVYGILRVLIWSFAVVSRARRVFAKDYPQKYRRFNKEKAR
jgi:hypothetical protein